MSRIEEQEYTVLSDREIAGTGLGTSPAAVAAFSDLQRAVYADQPADTAAIQASADAAASAAGSAQASADASAAAAGTAQTRADDAYVLAGTKVAKDVGPSWSVPTATPARTALPAYTDGTASVTYDATEIGALKTQVAALTAALAAVITDGRANHSLTS